jgi:hypothetical protein
VKILDEDNDDTYDDNGTASSAVLSASVSTRCGGSSGCEEGKSHQILKIVGNILNKEQRTSDKGFSSVSWMGVLLTSQEFDKLLRYGKFHKDSE